jgi:type VI secretion system protein ImpC
MSQPDPLVQSKDQTAAIPVATEARLLPMVIDATQSTEPDRTQQLVRTLAEEALKGTVTYSRNVTQTIKRAIAAIDEQISYQLAEIMHEPKFTQLEGSWRGLNHLVKNSETGPSIEIRVLNASKRELGRNFARAAEFDQSELFRKIYESEFGMPGGKPYGALIGDYEFTNHPDDIELLSNVSQVAEAAFAPFIAAASPQLLGLRSFTELAQPHDIEGIFNSLDYAKWRSFRDSESSRFVALTLPKVLLRLPYGRMTSPVEEFDFEEAPRDATGAAMPMPHEHYCWGNAAYALGAQLTEAFAEYGWCTAIRGVEGGGKVKNLPNYVFISDDGDPDQKCPTEIGITDERERELGKLGFLPLSHFKNTDYAVFFGAQTVQKPKKYDRPGATENAEISARLPYIMAASRFAHYLKIIARDKIGSSMEASDCEEWLNRWVNNYVNANDKADQETKARYPLREATVEVREIPGRPGSYNAIAHLRPWLQIEELTASLRMVARIPKIR